MSETSVLELILRRERWLLGACLLGVTLLAWAYLLSGAGMDMSMPGMVMAPMAWSPMTAIIMFAMWWIMMIAMMTPSAAPAVLLFSTIDRKGASPENPAVGAGIFLSGYLTIWSGFALAATALQWALETVGLMAIDMRVNSRIAGGLILVAAGLYQFTPLKSACLRHCQAPLLFLSTHWQQGVGGAFRMGLRHGAYCLGCCWFLMALLFVGGIMNLLWIAGLALYVALEKLLPGISWISYLAGAALTIAGALMIAAH